MTTTKIVPQHRHMILMDNISLSTFASPPFDDGFPFFRFSTKARWLVQALRSTSTMPCHRRGHKKEGITIAKTTTSRGGRVHLSWKVQSPLDFLFTSEKSRFIYIYIYMYPNFLKKVEKTPGCNSDLPQVVGKRNEKMFLVKNMVVYPW